VGVKTPFFSSLPLGRRGVVGGGGDTNQLFYTRTTLSSYLGESIYDSRKEGIHYYEIRKQACKKE